MVFALMVGGRALLLMLGGIVVLSIMMVGVAVVVMMVGMTGVMSMVGGLLLSMTVGGVVTVFVVGVVFMVRSDVIEGFWVLWENVQVIFFLWCEILLRLKLFLCIFFEVGRCVFL